MSFWSFFLSRFKKPQGQIALEVDDHYKKWKQQYKLIKKRKKIAELQAEIVQLLTAENQKLLNEQFHAQVNELKQKALAYFSNFICDCLYEKKPIQSFYQEPKSNYHQAIMNNKQKVIDLKNYKNFPTEKDWSELYPHIIGRSWTKKTMIESGINVEIKRAKKNDDSKEEDPRYLVITAPNGTDLASGTIFLDKYLSQSFYKRGNKEIQDLLRQHQIDFMQSCYDRGYQVIRDFLHYPPDLFPKEFIYLVGTTEYKFTEGQKLYDHLHEVADIAANIAKKLGLDPLLAKRMGFFHDLGKVETDHCKSENHTICGEKIGKKFNLDPEIIRIMRHHHDKNNRKDPYLMIIKAADVLSASRPGARVHDEEFYQKIRQKIINNLKAHDWVINCWVENNRENIVIFVNTTIKNDYRQINKFLIQNSLKAENIDQFNNEFNIKVFLIDRNIKRKKVDTKNDPPFDQFQFKNYK